MIIIPAIDLLGGKCVRLLQGDYKRVTVYSNYPEEVAMSFEQQGAELIHIVDLDGAKSGKPENIKTIEKIVRSISIPVEVGGGIRDIETAKRYSSIGVKRIVIGTKALEDPDFFSELSYKVDANIIAGIDGKNGKVAIKGWTEISEKSVIELAKIVEKKGVKGIIYTDISKDGMRVGPNYDATVDLSKNVSVPVIASGGVGSLDDIMKFFNYTIRNIYGVIVGKALYEGDINLREAITITKEKNSAY
ncbi:MAG: 1-(5-phosphoribosyl)-5-[(5-phosphoribosylamino)methylideneamino]imidazole-4-carboxamide isomerase [Proteobacteria bacterium]|nr:1-(5-phosphoribosyl)-5-[(5-phosphoribosylamino)methylideneamino]imidazole-4-carboxamide isomerase [Pseudomonadota bacterium]